MNTARTAIVLGLSLAFGSGVGIGFIVAGGGAGETIVYLERDPAPDESDQAETRVGDGEREGGRRRGAVRRRSREARKDDSGREGERRDDEKRDNFEFAEVREKLEAAIASGDFNAARHALHRMRIGPDAKLTDEEIAAWTATLDNAPLDLMHEMARFLARSGGAEGAALVAEWVSTADVPMDFLHRAIHGLADVPPDQRGEIAPVLEELMVSGLNRDLLRSTAHAYGRLHIDEQSNKDDGFNALMGLVKNRPEIDRLALLEATREFGTSENVGTMLELLGDGSDWSRRESQAILNSMGAIAARTGSGEALLELLKNPPESIGRAQIARMFGDSVHHLGPELLKEAIGAAKGDPRAQEMIARGLARSGRQGFEALLEASRDAEYGLEPMRFARALEESGREAVPTMMEMLSNHERHHVVEPLARAILEHGGAKDVAGLVDQIGGDGGIERRRGIAQALGDSWAKVDSSRLLDLLAGAQDHGVMEGLSRALIRSGNPNAVLPRLQEIRAGQANEHVRGMLDHAIRRLSEQARAQQER